MATTDVTVKVQSDNLTTTSQSTDFGQKSTVITVVASEPPESHTSSHLISQNGNDNAQVIYIEHTGSFPSSLPTETYQQILSFSKAAGNKVSIDVLDDIPVLREVNVCTTDKHPKGQEISNGNNLFKCETCDYSSNNKNYLKQHVDLVHNAGRPYKCPYCDYAGKRNHSLREHLVVHSNERPFECTHCNATFRKKGHLTNHIKLHAMSKVIKCSLCSDIIADQTSYTEHLKSVHKTDQLYACEMCQYVAGDENSIKQHMEQHSKVRLYQCSMCSFVTKALNLMESHLETHSKVNNTPKAVSDVSQINLKKTILNEHMASSSQTSVLIKCSECGFIAKDRNSMKNHMIKHLEVEKTDKPKVVQNVLPQKTSFKCTECSYTSSEAPSFIHHMLIHKTEAKKNNEAFVSVNKIKPISKENTCTTSNAPFIHDERTGRFICTICGYACEYQRTIKSHIWKHSGNKDIEYPMFQNGPLSVYEENVSRNQSDLSVVEREVKRDLANHAPNKEMAINHSAHVIPTSTTSQPPQQTQLMLNSKADICKIKICDGNILTLMKGSETQSLKLHEFSKMENKKPVFVSSVLNTNPKQVAVVVEPVQAVPSSHGYTGISSQQNSPKRAGTPTDESIPKKQKISKRETAMASSSVVKCEHMLENEVHGKVIETGDKTIKKRVEEGSIEPVEALLSLQKDEALANGPPSERIGSKVFEQDTKTIKDESIEVELLEEEVISEVEVSGASKVSSAAGGICSSLLAVIEQLRERSKSDIDLENYTKAGVRRSGRKRLRRASSEDEMPSEFSDNIEKIIEDGETRYRCKFCHYSNSKPLLIRIHMRLHKSKKPFECSLCDFIALSIEGLQDHMIQHCKVRTYQCKLCPSAFNYKSQLRAHMRAHNEKDPFICDFCDFVTSNIGAYHQHVQRHSNTSSYLCNNCQKKYSSKTSLMRHECTKISNDSLGELEGSSDEETTMDLVNDIKCPHCEFTCVKMADFKLHAVVHGDEEEVVPLKCELCDFTAVSNRSLKSHMKRHINDQRYVQQPLEQYKCNLCGYVCHHLPSLKSHMWRHASDRNYSYEFTNDVINAAIDYDIRVDGRDVNDPEILERVLNSERKIVEGRLNNTQQPGGKIPVCWVTFRCCQCGFETINKPELNVHMRSHADIIEQTLEVNNKLSSSQTIEHENSHPPVIPTN